MNNNYLISGFNITDDSDFLDEQNALSPALKEKIGWYHQLALEGKRSSIQTFLSAIQKYPDNPQLKNYLSMLYSQIGDEKKAYETNHWILAEHPDYLFAKLNLANECFLKEEYHKMPEILGEALELKALYPHRDTFHVLEVLAFFRCTVLYFTAIGNIDQAEIRYDIMNELDPDSPDTEMAWEHIKLATMKKAKDRFEEENKARISVKTKPQEEEKQIVAPRFENTETEWLYTHGLYIGDEKLNKILALPRKLIIRDLEMVLQDSIDRYAWFSDLAEDEGWEEDRMNFVVHALYLLGELEASESIESVLNALGQSDEYLDLYIGDFITAGIWEAVYKMGNHELEAFTQFMIKPGLNTYSKTAIAEMVEQMALHQPERREEVVAWFKSIIQFYLASDIDDNVIDMDLIGLLICNVIDISGVELLPDIQKLFEKGLVAVGVCGDWESVRDAMHMPAKHSYKRELLSISDRYEEITSTWAGYTEEPHINPNPDCDIDLNQPVFAEPKVGRNDPCPCGSGKKYKKCCLNK